MEATVLSNEWAGGDEMLVQQCLADDQEAWRLFHGLHHRQLLVWIYFRLGARANCWELAEDIAASVWTVVGTDAGRRLQAYDARQANLDTYLALLAEDEVRRVYRQQSRRHERSVG